MGLGLPFGLFSITSFNCFQLLIVSLFVYVLGSLIKIFVMHSIHEFLVENMLHTYLGLSSALLCVVTKNAANADLVGQLRYQFCNLKCFSSP